MSGNFFKSVTACVLMTLALAVATPAKADITFYGETPHDTTFINSVAILLTTAGIITTSSAARRHYDTTKAQSLIDEAYVGAGEKLDLLSAASQKSVEQIASVIVDLDQAGKINAMKPKQMAQAIAAAIK